jgi:fibronectin-binding autotransporter adhesin
MQSKSQTRKPDHPMKPKTALRHFLAAIGCSAIAISSASAADGTWTQAGTTQGDPAVPLTWSEPSNWLDSIVAGGADATAFFTQSATAAQTVTLDTDVTLGNLTLNRNQNLTLVPDALDPKSLTLDVTTGTPLVSTTSTRVIRIETAVAGGDGLEITGGGTGGGVALAGANTFTGGLHLNGGSLGINNNVTTTGGLNGNLITVSGTSYGAFVGGTNINGGVHLNAGACFVPAQITAPSASSAR